MKVKDLIKQPLKIRKKNGSTVVDSDMSVYINAEKIEVAEWEQLDEAVKQYDIDEMIGNLRNNHMFYAERGLRGASTFETGMCYEFALALYQFLKTKGENPELVFLVGNMKKADAEWYDTEEFDPTTEHPFHTVVKVRKYYYDINGRLGNKREILAMWSKFRRKKVVVVEPNEVKKYIKKPQMVKDLEEMFEIHLEDLKQWR